MLNVNWQRLESLVQPSWRELFFGMRARTVTRTSLEVYGYREDAMRALDATQQGALDHIRVRYPHNSAAAVESTLDSLNTYFLSSTLLSEKYVPDVSAAQKQVYYRDIFHTAYRCLLRPFNPWIAPDAREAKKNYLKRAQTTNFSEKQLATIAAIWKALNDEHFPLADGYTRESAKELFAETISDVGRAHNRDNNAKVDDMKADSPSCQMGINQRLIQFIMIALREDPSERILNADLMKQKFQEALISGNQNGRMSVFDKIEKLDLPRLNDMKEALDNLIINLENTPEEKQLLNQLFPWTTNDLAAFIDECKAYYGNDRIARKLDNAICFQEKRFDNFGGLILGLARDPLSAYYEEIKSKIGNRIERLSQPSTTESGSELEQLREKLVNLAIAENQEILIYQLLDGSPDFVKQIGRERGFLLLEEEREKQIQWAIQEGNEALVYQLLDGSPDFVRQTAEQRQAQQAAQNATNQLERLREELITTLLEHGTHSAVINQLLDGTPDFVVNYARQMQQRNAPVEYMEVEEDNGMVRLLR